MGMYDTFRYPCPKCGTNTDAQTKLGACVLDNWELGDNTTLPDGVIRCKDGCHKCGLKAIVAVIKSRFVAVYAEPPNGTIQEMHWGSTAPIGADPDKQLADYADALKKSWEED
jgi:ribosomal protein S27AE